MEWRDEWHRVSKRFSFNYQATDSFGYTCLHHALSYRRVKLEQWHSSYLILEIKWFLQNKAELCALNTSQYTRTTLALIYGLASEWYEALNTIGVSVEGVVLHTPKTATPSLVIELKNCLEWEQDQEHRESHTSVSLSSPSNQAFYDSLSNLSTFRACMVEVFAEHGCHITTTDFGGPNIYELSASAVDY